MQKIAVLGLGLNGMISSILSHKSGFDVIIFESGNLNKYKEDKRTSVLTFESIKFFKSLNIFDDLQEFLSPIFHIYTFEGKKSSILSLDAQDVSPDPFGFVIHNFELKKVLLNYINQLGIKIINTTLEGYQASSNFVKVVFDGKEENFKLILNCGGKNIEKKTFHKSYNQTAFVFNIAHTEDHRSIAVESFAPQGPLAVLPLEKPTESAVIWTVKNQTAKFLNNASSNLFLEHFKFAMQRMGHIGEVLNIKTDLKTYPLEISFNKSQVKEREILLGDAFNSIHPVAGSSFNMSIKDMKNLNLYLTKAFKLGLDIGSSYELKTFAKANLRHHIEMNTFTHTLVQMFSTSNQAVKCLRNIGVECIENSKLIKTFLIKRASGI